MKKCKDCQSEINDKASKCPHCQTDQRSWFRRHPIFTGIIGLLTFFIIFSAISGGNKTPSKSPSVNSKSVNTSSETEETDTKQAQETNIPTEYKSALNKATTYANMMHMSKKGVYNQLTSDYGEKFSAEAAQYAIDNVKTDWNSNALAKAKSYQKDQNMSPARIRDQLISEYGEKFTEAEADYALQNLNK